MKIYAPTARAARRVECPRSNGAPDSTPADFNATAHPIINRHWLGVDPFRPINLDRVIEAYQPYARPAQGCGWRPFPAPTDSRGAAMTAEVLTKALGGCWHGTNGIACCPACR